MGEYNQDYVVGISEFHDEWEYFSGSRDLVEGLETYELGDSYSYSMKIQIPKELKKALKKLPKTPADLYEAYTFHKSCAGHQYVRDAETGNLECESLDLTLHVDESGRFEML